MLRTDPETGELSRRDFRPDAWDGEGDVVAHWRGVMPDAKIGPRHRLPVDGEVLIELFRRLQGREDQADLRFAVGLTLLRERRATLIETGEDEWTLRLIGGERVTMIDPKLDEAALREATARVASLLGDGAEEDE